MAHPIEDSRALPGEHLEERVQDIACRAYLLLQPLGEPGAAGLRTAEGSDGWDLTHHGRRAARQAYALLVQAYRELRALQVGRDPENMHFRVWSTLEILINALAGALSGTTPIPAGETTARLATLAEQTYRQLQPREDS